MLSGTGSVQFLQCTKHHSSNLTVVTTDRPIRGFAFTCLIQQVGYTLLIMVVKVAYYSIHALGIASVLIESEVVWGDE